MIGGYNVFTILASAWVLVVAGGLVIIAGAALLDAIAGWLHRWWTRRERM